MSEAGGAPEREADRGELSLIGHRGTMGTEPENTVRSFRRAEADGADAVELDVRLSADGVLVVMHDAAVDRTTDGTGEVAALTARELAALDAGAGCPVPTLEEVFAAIALPVQAEVKAVEAFPVLARLLAGRRELAARVTVTSFHEEVLAASRRALPAIPRGLIAHHATPALRDRAHALGATWVCPGFDGLTAETVAEYQSAGLWVDAWPANAPSALKLGRELGVDAVTTNYPGAARGW